MGNIDSMKKLKKSLWAILGIYIIAFCYYTTEMWFDFWGLICAGMILLLAYFINTNEYKKSLLVILADCAGHLFKHCSNIVFNDYFDSLDVANFLVYLVLALIIVFVIVQEIDTKNAFIVFAMVQAIRLIFYCLYGYPFSLVLIRFFLFPIASIIVMCIVSKEYDYEKNSKGFLIQDFRKGASTDIPMSEERLFERRNIALCIILSIITCGIYGIVWAYQIVDDTHRLSRNEASPMAETLLIAFIPFYSLYWMYKNCKQMYENSNKIGGNIQDNSIVCMLFSLFGLTVIALATIQNEFNKFEIDQKIKARQAVFKEIITEQPVRYDSTKKQENKSTSVVEDLENLETLKEKGGKNMKCPECGEEILGTVTSCPNCGIFLKEDDNTCDSCEVMPKEETESVNKNVEIVEEQNDAQNLNSQMNEQPEKFLSKTKSDMDEKNTNNKSNVLKTISLIAGTFIIIVGFVFIMTYESNLQKYGVSFGGDFYTYTYDGIVEIVTLLENIQRAIGWLIVAIGITIDINAMKK